MDLIGERCDETSSNVEPAMPAGEATAQPETICIDLTQASSCTNEIELQNAATDGGVRRSSGRTDSDGGIQDHVEPMAQPQFMRDAECGHYHDPYAYHYPHRYAPAHHHCPPQEPVYYEDCEYYQPQCILSQPWCLWAIFFAFIILIIGSLYHYSA